jgi:signal transduction histidine kinase
LSVSHELRTPLTALRGYAEALADGTVDRDDAERTGRTMLAESVRLDRLIGDLLDLARLGAVDFRLDLTAVDVVDLLQRAATVWRDRAARVGVELRVESPAYRWWRGPIRRGCGRLSTDWPRTPCGWTPAGRPVVLAVRTDGDDAVVEVRDGGPGLTADDLAVAFDPGVLHARYHGVRPGGTGVGLALVSRLARRMSGSITASAAPEGGAAFTVRLPPAQPLGSGG